MQGDKSPKAYEFYLLFAELRSLCYLSSKDGCGGNFIFKTLPQFASLIKDNALNNFCGKTLGIVSF